MIQFHTKRPRCLLFHKGPLIPLRLRLVFLIQNTYKRAPTCHSRMRWASCVLSGLSLMVLGPHRTRTQHLLASNRKYLLTQFRASEITGSIKQFNAKWPGRMLFQLNEGPLVPEVPRGSSVTPHRVARRLGVAWPRCKYSTRGVELFCGTLHSREA
jgi:hypothetical protein